MGDRTAFEIINHLEREAMSIHESAEHIEFDILTPDDLVVHLCLSYAGLDQLLQSTASFAQDVFPDVDAREGAIRLIALDLRERIFPGNGSVKVVRLDRTGSYQVEKSDSNDWSLPPSEYAWEANWPPDNS